MDFTKEEKETLLSLICQRQTKMLARHPRAYMTEEYLHLEAIKVKIRNWGKEK